MGDLRRNIGKISVDRNLMMDVISGKVPNIFRDFIMVKCDHDFLRYTYDFIAHSELFDMIEDGEIIPTYTLSVTLDNNVNEYSGEKTVSIKSVVVHRDI